VYKKEGKGQCLVTIVGILMVVSKQGG